MRRRCLIFGLVTIFAFAFLTVSCAKKNMVQKSDPEVIGTEEQTTVSNVPDEPPQTSDVTLTADGYEFDDENIQFEFNSAVLTERAQSSLTNKAQYLLFYPDVPVTIEGHCDDRGTDAYNIALGERRAESVKMFLVDLGIGADRLSTISYGEERPIDRGHNETAWAKNRRAQFVKN